MPRAPRALAFSLLALLALLAVASAASGAQLRVHPDGGLRMIQPVQDVALVAECTGTPPAPTWRVGAEGFTVGTGDREVRVQPRTARDIQLAPLDVTWTVSWSPQDVDLLATDAAVAATLLADTGQGFAELGEASSAAAPLLGGETTFTVRLAPAAKTLPAGSALALEVRVQGTEACADGAAGLTLTEGGLALSPASEGAWDYIVVVEPNVAKTNVLLWATVTSPWGGYDEEPLAVDLEIDGPSEAEGRVLSGPFAHRQDEGMRDAGERLFSWTWQPGLQGAAPGIYKAKVTAYPLRIVEGFPSGTGEAEIAFAPPVETPAPALLAALAALAVAASAARRIGRSTK